MIESTLCIVEYRDGDWVFRAVEIPLPNKAIEQGFSYAKTDAALYINEKTMYGVQKIDRITIKSTKTQLQ